MRILRHIAIWVLCGFSIQAWSQDYARLSETTIMGTARYVGMGGAMTAIGGDPSSVQDNAAGLGLYRRPEVLLTLDYAGFLMAPQSSIIFSLPTDNTKPNGIRCHNLMFSYHRLHSFYRDMSFAAKNEASLGALMDAKGVDIGVPYCIDPKAACNLLVRENGYVNEYALNWAMNIANRWYWGLGLRIHSFSFSSEGDYLEVFDYQNYYNRSKTVLLMNGAGCSLATGLIARPLSWLRLGVGIQTPSLGSITTSTQGTFDANTDSLRWSDAPDLRETGTDFHMPLQLSTSVAFQISHYAMIALQYNYRHMSGRPDLHSLRAGFEVVPIAGLYINGGYVYESPFSRSSLIVPIDPSMNRQDAYYQELSQQQYISCGVGYRGCNLIVQAAYQYSLRQINLSAHEMAPQHAMNGITHRIVLTVGWHGYY